jgi:hypothetical protein
VLVAENPIVKKLFNFEIGFTVRGGRLRGVPAVLMQHKVAVSMQRMLTVFFSRARLSLANPARTTHDRCAALPAPPAQVTKKDKEAETQWVLFKKALTVTWPHLTYYAAFTAGVIYFIVTAAMGWYRCGTGASNRRKPRALPLRRTKSAHPLQPVCSLVAAGPWLWMRGMVTCTGLNRPA